MFSPMSITLTTSMSANLPVHSLVLLLGPAASGKSELAHHFLDQKLPGIVLGTSTLDDPTLRERVEELRAFRPTAWRTKDVQVELPATIASDLPRCQILIDSVSQWLGSLIAVASGRYDLAQTTALCEQETRDLCQGLYRMNDRKRVVVSAEVGAAPSPERDFERLYRTRVGLLNQQLAAVADAVFVVHAGIPLRIK